MGFVTRWLVTCVAVLLVAFLLPGVVSFPSLGSVAVFALVLGLINAFVRPVLWLLTLPLTILTLGIFSLVLNLALFGLAVRLVPGISIGGGLVGLVIASVAISVVSAVLGRVVRA